MEFEWDVEKAESNYKKHGISFSFATLIFEDPNMDDLADQSIPYGEDRWIATGFVPPLMLSVVYTLRGSKIRLISARKATPYEQRRYWNS